MFDELKKKYDVIYADPPWEFKDKKTGGSFTSGAASKYSTMTIEELKTEMKVAEIAKENAFLFMWWVTAQPQEALDLVKAWGFLIKNMCCFNWNKKTKHGKDCFGMGHYSRPQSEFCLVAIKGKPKVVSHSVRQRVKHAVGDHSEKPAIVRHRIDQLSGKLSSIELFARDCTTVANWDFWGDEVKERKKPEPKKLWWDIKES